MRVLHVIARFIGGGPERSVLALARHTAALGATHDHVVAVLEPPLASRLVLQARRLGVRVVPRPDAHALRELVVAADVTEIHYWNHPTLRRTLQEVTLPAARVLVWARVLGTTPPQVLPAELAHLADRLVVTSDLSVGAEAVVEARRRGIGVETIPGVADMARLDGFVARSPDGRGVGYLGSTSPAKMHPRFVELAAAVPVTDARFVVYGSGGDDDQLRARARATGLGARLQLRGHVEDIRDALEEIDVFGYPLAPDTSATSEKALQEAMWVGIPPVVLPSAGVTTLVEDGVTGLVAPDEAAYPDAVARLLRDAALRRRLGEGARRYAHEAFDPERWARATLTLLEGLAAEPRREHPPLAGAGEGGAGSFVRALGGEGDAFATSLAGPADGSRAEVDQADVRIAAAAPNLVHGEGGILHYRNTYPDDPHLRLWSALVCRAAGRTDTALAELHAAVALGLGDDRPVRYAAELTEGPA